MINYIEHHIVDHCNLKCAGCSHFSGLAQPWFEKIEDFIKDFSALAEKTNHHIPTIRIMGGEPLLHPQIESFLFHARMIFPKSEIQVVTNGILLKEKGQAFKDFCNQFGIRVCVSNYGLNMDLQELLNGFTFTRIDWKNELYHIGLDTTGSQDPQTAFSKCDLSTHKWYFFQHGRMYPCCIVANIPIFNSHFNLQLGEGDLNNCSIDVASHSLEEIEEFLATPIPFCKYCNTEKRSHSYHKFSVSKGDINEWIYQ